MPDYLHLTMQLLDSVCCHVRKLLRINLFTKNSDTFYDFFFSGKWAKNAPAKSR